MFKHENGLPPYPSIFFFSRLLAPIPATLFIYIVRTGTFPSNWVAAIAIIIYSRSLRNNSVNYSPISLFDITSKICAKCLLGKLENWLEEKAILVPEEVDFCCNHSTLDKYIVGLAKHISVADLKEALDSILHEHVEKATISGY